MAEILMSTSELETKTERLKALLSRDGLGGVLLKTHYNFAWLTGGGNSCIDESCEEGNSFLLVRNDGKRYLLANRIEIGRMLAEEVSEKDFEPIEYEWQQEIADSGFITQLVLSILGNGLLLGSDSFAGNNVRLIDKNIDPYRYEMTCCEMNRFKEIGREAAIILDKITESINPGQTEIDIANAVRFEFGKKGFSSVVTLVAADERISNFRHPVPTDRVWRKSLMIVVCPKKHGLIPALTRIYSAGEPSDHLKRITDSNALIHARMMHASYPGASAKEIFEIARKGYAEAGFAGEELKHHQGGGCGYRPRDWMTHSCSPEKVMLNQAIAWNPSITGTKSEETFIVKEDGIDVITSSLAFPVIVNTIDGKEYRTSGVMEI